MARRVPRDGYWGGENAESVGEPPPHMANSMIRKSVSSLSLANPSFLSFPLLPNLLDEKEKKRKEWNEGRRKNNIIVSLQIPIQNPQLIHPLIQAFDCGSLLSVLSI